jgi:hypothetical protein
LSQWRVALQRDPDGLLQIDQLCRVRWAGAEIEKHPGCEDDHDSGASRGSTHLRFTPNAGQ